MTAGVRAEIVFPHSRVTVRELTELPEWGDELEEDGVTFTVAEVRIDEGLLPLVVLAGVIGPPVLVGAGGWGDDGPVGRVPEPVA